MRIWLAALCVAASACRDRGAEPRIEVVEPSAVYFDETPVLVIRGTFEPPVTAELDDPSRSRLGAYAVQLVSDNQVIDLPSGAFRNVGQVETTLLPATPPGVYTVRLTDPWGRSTDRPQALAIQLRWEIPPDGGPIDIDPPDAGPVRAPPSARFEIYPPYDIPIGLINSTDPVTFDASGSTDTQTPTADLRVSWNFTGAVGPAPWPSWTTTKTASARFSSGVVSVVLAVTDADDDIGYASRAIGVASRDTDICIVNNPLPVDDGAEGCSGNSGSGSGRGTDGLLSLDEAARLAGGMAGIQTLLLAVDPAVAPVTFTGPALTLDSAVNIIGMKGAILGRELIAGNVPIHLIGVEVEGPAGRLTIPHGFEMEVLDSYLRDTRILVSGDLTLKRSRVERCADTCIQVNGINAELTVSHSSFAGMGSGYAIDAPQCIAIGNGYSLDLVANTFFGFGTAIRIGASCERPTRIVHQTFHGNDVALDYVGGSGHVLRNNIFTAQITAAVTGCAVPFAVGERRDHLLYGNNSNGCLAGDEGIAAFNPLYVSSSTGDFRLRFGSPAINSAPLLGIDVNGPAPNNHQGTAPDFGGRETY